MTSETRPCLRLQNASKADTALRRDLQTAKLSSLTRSCAFPRIGSAYFDCMMCGEVQREDFISLMFRKPALVETRKEGLPLSQALAKKPGVHHHKALENSSYEIKHAGPKPWNMKDPEGLF